MTKFSRRSGTFFGGDMRKIVEKNAPSRDVEDIGPKKFPDPDHMRVTSKM